MCDLSYTQQETSDIKYLWVGVIFTWDMRQKDLIKMEAKSLRQDARARIR